MTRYLISLSYKGTAYSGWQRQTTNLETVQEYLEKALRTIFKLKITATGASRTDTGVHALDQKIIFTVPRAYKSTELKFLLNSHLPEDIRVNSCEMVDPNYKLLELIKEKTYVYKLSNQGVNALLNETVFTPDKSVKDMDLFKDALVIFIGEHNFKSFSVPGKRNSIRKVSSIQVIENAGIFHIHIKASGFLKYMIRFIIGASMQAANGELSLAQIQNELKNPTESLKILKAPAKGLVLESIALQTK
jgi:tRNA pseudouridine38-40 synthase